MGYPQTAACGARLKYITRAIRVPMLQNILHQYTFHLASILLRNQGTQCTARFLHFRISRFTATAVYYKIIFVAGHVPTTHYAFQQCAHWQRGMFKALHAHVTCLSLNQLTSVHCPPGLRFFTLHMCTLQCVLCAYTSAQCVHKYMAWNEQIRNRTWRKDTFCSTPIQNKVTVVTFP